MPQVAPASALVAAAAMPSGALLRLLSGFRSFLFAVVFVDLGKCRCYVAFRAGSACETAQKLRVGFAGHVSEACSRALGAASEVSFAKWMHVVLRDALTLCVILAFESPCSLNWRIG